MGRANQRRTASDEVQHDETIGGSDGNPHADSASVADLSEIQASVGGALFDESETVETVNQFWRFYQGEEEFFEDLMDNEDQAGVVTEYTESMRVVF